MRLSILIICMGVSISLFSQNYVELPLWPGGVPESNGILVQESRNESGHFQHVTVPSIYVYKPDSEKNNGSAVVICPGGGYAVEAFVHEGTDIAQWLASNGTTGIVLKYRLPNQHHAIPLMDAQEAIRLVRRYSKEWGVDPKKVGIMGSSAGGHLASTAATHFDKESRPDFAILFYPVITMSKEFTHLGSRENLLGKTPSDQLVSYYSNELQVNSDTPPTLLLLSDDDTGVLPKNSIEFYSALKRNNVPASMYIFPVGGHGWGFRDSFPYHEKVKSLIHEWMKQILK